MKMHSMLLACILIFHSFWACLFLKWVRSRKSIFLWEKWGSLFTCQTRTHIGVMYGSCYENSKPMSKHSRTWTETRWYSSSIHNMSTLTMLRWMYNRWIFLKDVTSHKLHELFCTVLQSLWYMCCYRQRLCLWASCVCFPYWWCFMFFHLSFRSPCSSSTW